MPRSDKGETCRAVEAGQPVWQPPYSTQPISRRVIRFSQPVERELYVTTRNVPFVRNLLDSVRVRTRAKPGRPYHVLALSAGGEGGAYGAGVVAGWKYNAAYPPPGFDLVTGISTGALLAPLVFLDEDAAAKRLYTNIASDDIYRPRSGLELLFANSLTDTAPLRDKVRNIVTDEFVARIAVEGRKGRVLAIQAVDLDAGESVVFDLTAIAQGKNFPVCAQRSPRDCIVDALLAASAVPVAFPPVFIDGEMYVDGGLRQHGFTINLINGVLHSPTAAARSLDSPEGFALRLPSTPDPEAASINLTLVANTDLQYPLICTGNGLRDIAERSAGIMTDQLAIGSFFRLLAETQSHPGGSAKFTYADPALTGCALGQSEAETLTGKFNPAYMRCLYRAGCALAATGTVLWHTQPTDLPHSPIARHPGAGNFRPPDLNAPAICAVEE
jgi:hypothetical protein